MVSKKYNREVNMQVELMPRHYEPTERVKNYVQEELNKLKLFENQITKCRVLLEKVKEGDLVEITLHAWGKDFIAHAVSDDMIKSIDQAIGKMERQLQKYKEKRIKR